MGNKQRLSNNNLIIAFKRNDQKAMQEVYQITFPKVKGYVLKNSGTETQAKDVFQEAFISCWKNIKDDKITGESNVAGYLFTIAKNKWIDYLRSADYKKTTSAETFSYLKVVVDESDGIDNLEEEQNRKVLHSALAQLGDNCKMLLKLFYFERKSMEEISLQMGIAANSARNQKYRCMEKLRSLSLKIKKNEQ
jgi:RNA polymerase sigma factor (sigma-70 family)